VVGVILTAPLTARMSYPSLIRVPPSPPTPLPPPSQRDFETAQNLLLGPANARNTPSGSNLEAAFSNKHLYAYSDHSSDSTESDVDVLVCTAGRLLDHLQVCVIVF
jgi:hypothetical protein